MRHAKDATALSVLAGETVDKSPTHDLTALAQTYLSQTGVEVAVYGRTGQTVVGFDPSEPVGSEPSLYGGYPSTGGAQGS